MCGERTIRAEDVLEPYWTSEVIEKTYAAAEQVRSNG
jgi:hypothetical protein